jgi:hypothetical protein
MLTQEEERSLSTRPAAPKCGAEEKAGRFVPFDSAQGMRDDKSRRGKGKAGGIRPPLPPASAA